MNICEVGKLAEIHSADWLPENGAIINCECEEEARSLAPLLYKDVDFIQLAKPQSKDELNAFRETLGEVLARFDMKERKEWTELFADVLRENLHFVELVIERAKAAGNSTVGMNELATLDRHVLDLMGGAK